MKASQSKTINSLVPTIAPYCKETAGFNTSYFYSLLKDLIGINLDFDLDIYYGNGDRISIQDLEENYQDIMSDAYDLIQVF